jgi:branched-chain amino acid transport system substrate-binding protein
MTRLVPRSAKILAIAAVFSLVVAACSNASNSTSAGSQTEGVTSSEIDVGGIAAATGPLANQYSPIFGAVQAYFDMVNAEGGVDGRKLKYVAQLDDQSLPSLDVSQARALVEQDHVFAIVGVATPIFAAGTYLGQTGVPTFGWNVNPEWSDGPNLFGEKGSYLNFTGASPYLPYLAKRLGLSKIGTIAYTVQQSAQCATGASNSFAKFGGQMVLKDTSLPFGFTDISGDVTKLKDSGAQMVTTCMDPTGNTTLSKGLQEAGLFNKIVQYWPNGYDQATLNQYAPLMEGAYFGTAAGNVPYEHGYTKGMDQYLDTMAAHNLTIGDVTLAGWINADLFVNGLRKLGHNVTRQGLIDAINKMTDYTANGILSGINWTVQHNHLNTIDCNAYIQVQHGRFVSVFGQGRNPFVCFQAPVASTTNPVPFPGNPATFFNSTAPPPPSAPPVPPGT